MLRIIYSHGWVPLSHLPTSGASPQFSYRILIFSLTYQYWKAQGSTWVPLPSFLCIGYLP